MTISHNFLIGLVIVLALSNIILVYYLKVRKNIADIDSEKMHSPKNTSDELLQIKIQQELLLEEKKKVAEKKQKVWKMGETALKEKHKAEETLGQLSNEKEMLMAEKKKIEEKVKKLWATSTSIHKERSRSDELLLNILPFETATELKATGKVKARSYNSVTVMFTDFKNFTKVSETMSAEELVQEINFCYSEFDRIISNHNLEKIKTIGDSYMCAGGLPIENETHAIDVTKAALDIQQFIQQYAIEKKKTENSFFEIRIGIHTGPVVAGVVGIKKFAFDIWGDAVNIASRMESSSEAGKINISGTTYNLVKEDFTCIHRGKIEAKNKGVIDMYFVEHILKPQTI